MARPLLRQKEKQRRTAAPIGDERAHPLQPLCGEGTSSMAQTERNDPETQYSDAPGTRALTKGSLAIVAAFGLALVAFIAAAFGLLPALVLLVFAIPLGIWGKNKLAANDRQIRPQS